MLFLIAVMFALNFATRSFSRSNRSPDKSELDDRTVPGGGDGGGDVCRFAVFFE
jgi:hypothetical protein